VRVYLPPGGWYHLWNGERIEGPRYLEVTAPLDWIPVYGREGTLLPLGPVVQHTGELEGKPAVTEVWAFGEPERELLTPELAPWVDDLSFEPGRMTKQSLGHPR
jgi:alpha-D-xyloside xylohydrolase